MTKVLSLSMFFVAGIIVQRYYFPDLLLFLAPLAVGITLEILQNKERKWTRKNLQKSSSATNR